MIKAIACVDEKWGIGKNGNLLMRIPEDMKFFNKITDGEICIMGRKTWESIPARNRPLKNRYNVVLSNQLEQSKKYRIEIFGDTVIKDAKQIVLFCKLICIEDFLKMGGDEKINTFIIGGGNTYSQLLKYCDEVYITKIYADLHADTFFPELSAEKWDCSSISEKKKYNNIEYQFYKYRRKET